MSARGIGQGQTAHIARTPAWIDESSVQGLLGNVVYKRKAVIQVSSLLLLWVIETADSK